MKLVDARSGQTFNVPALGKRVLASPIKIQYGDGEFTQIDAVDIGFLTAKALTTVASKDYTGKLSTWTGWSPLSVRYTHPGFPLQKVAFIPS